LRKQNFISLFLRHRIRMLSFDGFTFASSNYIFHLFLLSFIDFLSSFFFFLIVHTSFSLFSLVVISFIFIFSIFFRLFSILHSTELLTTRASYAIIRWKIVSCFLVSFWSFFLQISEALYFFSVLFLFKFSLICLFSCHNQAKVKSLNVKHSSNSIKSFQYLSLYLTLSHQMRY